ncbi:MAG: hypothetical protein KAT65_21215, partial [Methanophagales archaeon]|nr:hypothetical protein [Methanophagales archaeon]
MPEYLAPGVYVEEIEIGAKPIEGVSTTTTGFLGMAERGDLNKPTLVTSFAEYQRIFGGYLAEKVYGNKRGLPYAVEGFFVNGGQRLYVSRVATENAVKSSGFLPDISGKSISLAEEVKAKAITLKVKEGATGLKKDDVLLLKDGPQSEYLKFVSTAKALTLDVPLNQSYAKDTEIKKMKQGTTAATTYTIQEDMAANVVVIKLDKVTGLGENDVLLINDPTNSEICIVESVGTTEEKSIEVKTPLRFAHAKNVEIKKLTTTATTKELISVVKAGYTDVPITATDTDFSPDDAIKIGDEYFIIRAAEADKVILIADELKHPHKMDEEIKQLVPAIEVKAVNEGTWGDKIKIVVKESTSSSAKLAADALNQNFLDLDTVTGMEKGTLLKLHTTPLSYETVTEVIKTDDTKRVVLENAVGSLSAGEEVSTVEFDIIVSFDGFDEAFKKLSMNEAHSRHVEKVITPESSKLISVNDVSTTVEASQKIPMPSQDKEPGWKLSGGNDGIPDDRELNTTYEGSDSQEPAERTGLYTFKNIDEISIAAIPGITTQHLQNKLIIHCESMKDRFAVLDSEEKADFDAIQRQGNLYDSKYAALYYPWIRV